LMGITMVALYYVVKWTNGERLGRLAILPPVLFLSLTVDGNFLHYSSEHLSICLTTIALAATAYLAKEGNSASSHVMAGAVAGFLLPRVNLIYRVPRAVPHCNSSGDRRLSRAFCPKNCFYRPLRRCLNGFRPSLTDSLLRYLSTAPSFCALSVVFHRST